MLIYLTMIDSEEDKSKFEKIYLTYRQTMFYVANRIIKDEYMAEDIVHQSFLRLINHLDKINEIDCHKTRAFIVIIVENIAIDFYRKRKRENTISFDEIELTIYDRENENQMGLNEIEMAICKLPISYLTVFKLKYSQGYNNKEIADILKISEDNVRQRILRGKRKLTEILNESEESL